MTIVMTNSPPRNRLTVTKAELSKMLGISQRTIDNWIGRGMLPAPINRVSKRGGGGKVLFSLRQVKSAIERLEPDFE